MAKKAVVYTSLYAVTLGIIASLFLLQPLESDAYPTLRLVIIFCSGLLLTKYAIYMIISPWHDVQRAFSNYPRQDPWVSILIPAYNEGSGVVNTVKTILQSHYRNIEIIVVNDGSKDNSDTLMREFIQENTVKDIVVRYFYKENGGKGRALNYALEQSCGDIVLTIDADCALTPTTVGEFVRTFDDPRVMAAVGNVKIANTETVIGVVQYLEFLFSFNMKKAESVLGMVYIIGGAAGAFRREVFSMVGDFDHTTITEDIELTMRIQKAGLKIVYASEAVVYTEGASNFTSLCKQRLRWKRGLFETLGKHPNMLFSVEDHHSRALCWFLLPLVYFGNVQLTLELFFLAFLYVYSFLTHDFSSFISGIVVVSSMFAAMMLFEGKESRKAGFILLAPIGWLIFYASTVVEFQALARTVWCIMTGKQVVWQKWERKGIALSASQSE